MSTTLTLEILLKMKELISSPENWLKGHSATTANGIGCNVSAPDACKFCVSGAYHRAIHLIALEQETYAQMGLKITNDVSNAQRKVWELLNAIAEAKHHEFKSNIGVVIYNDLRETTHANIIAVLDEAIERAKTL